MTASANQPQVGRPSTSEILAQERSKIVKMLNELADLKFFAIGTQRNRLENIELVLRMSLAENQLELRHAQSVIEAPR